MQHAVVVSLLKEGSAVAVLLFRWYVHGTIVEYEEFPLNHFLVYALTLNMHILLLSAYSHDTCISR